MAYRNALAFLGAAVILFFTARDVMAQEATSFEQLQVLVKPGNTVYVTDSMGIVTQGRIASLSTTSLRLASKGSMRDFSEFEVSKIRQWRHDSVRNGAGIGAGIGLGLAVAGAVIYCQEWNGCGGGEVVGILGFYTGIGAAIGVGIDALIPSKDTVYIGGRRTSLSRLKFKPILNHSGKGLAVAFSF